MTELPLGLARHELSSIFGDLPPDELQDLANDIKKNGQRELVAVFEGKILDGWHRYVACQMVGVVCQGKEFPATSDPITHVAAKNLWRRNITKSQRSAIIHRIALLRGGEVPSTATLAKAAGVSQRTMQRAVEAEKNGVAEDVIKGKSSLRGAPQDKKKIAAFVNEIAEKDELISEQRERLEAAAAEIEWYATKTLPENELTQKCEDLMRQIETLKARLNEEMEKSAALTRECHFLRKKLAEKK